MATSTGEKATTGRSATAAAGPNPAPNRNRIMKETAATSTRTTAPDREARREPRTSGRHKVREAAADRFRGAAGEAAEVAVEPEVVGEAAVQEVADAEGRHLPTVNHAPGASPTPPGPRGFNLTFRPPPSALCPPPSHFFLIALAPPKSPRRAFSRSVHKVPSPACKMLTPS